MQFDKALVGLNLNGSCFQVIRQQINCFSRTRPLRTCAQEYQTSGTTRKKIARKGVRMNCCYAIDASEIERTIAGFQM